MRRVSLILVAGSFLAVSVNSRGATVNASSLLQSDVAAAISLAAAGDTVLLPAGTNYNWTSLLNVSKSVILKGAGTNSTFIGPWGFYFQANVNNWRVTQITFNGLNGQSGQAHGVQMGCNGCPQGCHDYRIDHCLFTSFNDGVVNSAPNGYQAILHWGFCYGVVDHNIFYDCTGEIIDYCADSTLGWNRPDPSTNGIGGYTNGTVFVEDNGFVSGPHGEYNNLTDGNQGKRMCLRYNWGYFAGIENIVEQHGFEVNCNENYDYAAVRSMEIYCNKFTNSVSGFENGFWKIRGGSGIAFSNDFYTVGSGVWNNSMRLLNLRSYAYGLGGTITNIQGQIWEHEAHVDTDNGGPLINEGLVNGQLVFGHCNQQPHDIYYWGNTNRTTGAAFTTFNVDTGNTRDYQQQDIVNGRDFTNAPPRFGYIPYPYPHPLVVAQDGGQTNPIISASQSINFSTVAAGSSNTMPALVSNAGGGTLSGSASGLAYPFSFVGSANYSLGPNQSQNLTIAFAPTNAGTYTATVTLTGGGGATMSVNGTAQTVSLGLSFASTAGIVGNPFQSNADNTISQSVLTTDPTQGGQAIYPFVITQPGSYLVQANVYAPDASANSFFVNIDSQPDTNMIWNIPIFAGFTNEFVTWVSTGGVSPQSWTLATGSHELIIRGREAGVELGEISILAIPSPPLGLRVVGSQ